MYVPPIGGPAAPEVSLTSVSSSELVLQWPHPFSWSDAPVTGYDVHVSPPINGRSSWALTNNSLRMVAGATPPSLCQRHQFTVVASNALGSRTSRMIYGGFPAGKQVQHELGGVWDGCGSKRGRHICTLE